MGMRLLLMAVIAGLPGCDRLLAFGPSADGIPADLVRGDAGRPVPVRGGGTSGGPLQGRLTVFTQTEDGTSIGGVWVHVKLPNGSLVTVTNAAGVAELVDPRLVGPVTVTAGKKSYVTVTLDSMVAASVTVPMADRGATALQVIDVPVGPLLGAGGCARATPLATIAAESLAIFLTEVLWNSSACQPENTTIKVSVATGDSSACLLHYADGSDTSLAKPLRLAVVQDVNVPGDPVWWAIDTPQQVTCSGAWAAIGGLELGAPANRRLLATRLAVLPKIPETFWVPTRQGAQSYWVGCSWTRPPVLSQKVSAAIIRRGLQGAPETLTSPPMPEGTAAPPRLGYKVAASAQIIRLDIAPAGEPMPFWTVFRLGGSTQGSFDFTLPADAPVEPIVGPTVARVVVYNMPELTFEPLSLRFAPTWTTRLMTATWEGPWIP